MVIIYTLGEGNVKHSHRFVHHVEPLCDQAAPSDGRVSGRQLVRISVLPFYVSCQWSGADSVDMHRRARRAGRGRPSLRRRVDARCWLRSFARRGASEGGQSTSVCLWAMHEGGISGARV